jgi:hypothetical protein
VEGRSIRFEARWAQGRSDRLPGLAAELVRLRVDVLVTGGSESAHAAKKATATIPIVMATGADPVKLGLVESLGRPGGNVTGEKSQSSELVAKRVELLRELLPKISRVAVLSDGTPPSAHVGLRCRGGKGTGGPNSLQFRGREARQVGSSRFGEIGLQSSPSLDGEQDVRDVESNGGERIGSAVVHVPFGVQTVGGASCRS